MDYFGIRGFCQPERAIDARALPNRVDDEDFLVDRETADVCAGLLIVRPAWNRKNAPYFFITS